VTVKSRQDTRANREGTSKAGKGPLKHHEENREGPGQKKREAQRASRAMRKHGRAVRKQGRSWGKQGKTEAAGGRRGREAGENRKGASRIGEGPGGKAMDHGSIGEEQGRSRGERGRKQQEQERSWELLTGRTGEGKNQAGNWQQRQNLRRSGKEWETSGEEAW